MRILCDQNVSEEYRRAFDQADGITVSTVREELREDATDSEIALFASANNWVVFTNDDDFYSTPGEFGLLLFDQLEDPAQETLSRPYAVSRTRTTMTPISLSMFWTAGCDFPHD